MTTSGTAVVLLPPPTPLQIFGFNPRPASPSVFKGSPVGLEGAHHEVLSAAPWGIPWPFYPPLLPHISAAGDASAGDEKEMCFHGVPGLKAASPMLVLLHHPQYLLCPRAAVPPQVTAVPQWPVWSPSGVSAFGCQLSPLIFILCSWTQHVSAVLTCQKMTNCTLRRYLSFLQFV